jgi:hypothetical protein
MPDMRQLLSDRLLNLGLMVAKVTDPDTGREI